MDHKKTIKNLQIRKNGLAFGVDLEKFDNLPIAENYSLDAFYLRNFSTYEITYCTTSANPIESFTGLFCAKEAILKADNSLIGTEFSEIEILHDINGAPYANGFSISISHIEGIAVAFAIKNIEMKSNHILNISTLIISITALAFSLGAVLLYFYK